VILGPKDFIEYTYLDKDEKDAWKYYLKKGLIKQALENCSSN
jgi:hypothetical protein